MQVAGALASFANRLDTSFQTSAAPPTTDQLVDSISARPSAEFQGSASASKFTPSFTPDANKLVDFLA
jgi:hypothetical protein